ncbi:MAG: hypothetical protein EOO50_14220 [Flavobacterium sp.]|nr:MAG: hypothetical protein EOO50_14220 [Flavobacterium sp.]
MAILVFCFALTGCKGISKDDISKINGYWQIEKVVTANGQDKQYQGNTSYDFFKIHNGKGTRTKVMPQLDGSFLTNNINEQITVRFDDGDAYLDYVTEYAKWSEEVRSVSTDEMVLVNAQKIEYHYKKAGPIKLDDDGQTTK